eukprot:Polyplicarium_translucidae@DN3409_c8_g1_i2.p1
MERGVLWYFVAVVYFTMGVPLLLLAIITARGASLPGAGDGIRHYIGGVHASVGTRACRHLGELSEQPEMWTAAVGQIFFSIGVCHGVMTAYAPFNSSVVYDTVSWCMIPCPGV